MQMLKNIIKVTAVMILTASLFGCSFIKPQIDDGPGMVYHDADYRTQYANVLDFDNYEGQPYFAVAFLGYCDIMDYRNAYIEKIFESLSDEQKDKIQHFNFEGNEWYLVIPRYKDAVEITNLDTNTKYTIYQGEAFTVKCNLSNMQTNIEIGTDYNGEHKFSPQISGDGKLITDADVHDITDYSATTDYFMEGE